MVREDLREEVINRSIRIEELCELLKDEASQCFGWDEDNDWGIVGDLSYIENQLSQLLMDYTGISREEIWPKK